MPNGVPSSLFKNCSSRYFEEKDHTTRVTKRTAEQRVGMR